MSDFNTIKLEINDAVATLTLNRPNAANSMNVELSREVSLASIIIDEDPTIRAVIITGKGKMFSAGGDLSAFAADPAKASSIIKEITTYIHAAMARFARMEKPVIIAINGTAAGAGFSLAVAGDLVICAESAKFTMAYTAAGLSPDVSASYYLPRLIGLRKTQELMLTNRRLSSEEALSWGLVTQVVADNEVLPTAQALAHKLANGPTLAFGQVKQLLLASGDNNLEGQLELESRGIARMANSSDGQEGVRAFLEKRHPVFTGQ
ncbi:2-(1,2-epoxy-1,2-dihydrophenyl)acetyl-CoA isomerase [Sinobacterium caligoides]|uniref:2-(1,2-epoxy-1,2-dihydrophenyl)acetyl-CoA isomerase n=1 Tax=Sinobacterium caligoides TaxID=933926 RepID=A0A3N2DYX4_9GAMM|nr:enoyl-CoA hydratase-related protein [Sinobacterium caligoides]ROS04689.1 2-(1,2-epoxy-1,2-dihydrophenyl)acetyl-CoA isomerase [Sinobacterium caligoides]